MIHQIGTAEPRAPLRLIGPEQGHAEPGFPCSRLSGGDYDLVRTAPTRTTLGLSRAGPPHRGALPHRATPRQGERPAPTGSAPGVAHWASPSGPTAACSKAQPQPWKVIVQVIAWRRVVSKDRVQCRSRTFLFCSMQT